jgi:limonene-1,2-epoxide hydrolase
VQFIIDHLTGVIVSAIVILIIATTQLRSRDASIDATQYAAAKTRVMAIAEAIERDFSNLGSGVDSVKYAIIGFDTVSSPMFFEFVGQTVQGDPTPRTIRYQWQQSGYAQLANAVTRPTYTIERRINGVVSGTSMDTITGFEVDLMTADSNAVVTNYADTRIVGVLLTAVSPVGVSKEIEQTRWRRVFRPVNMLRQ